MPASAYAPIGREDVRHRTQPDPDPGRRVFWMRHGPCHARHRDVIRLDHPAIARLYAAVVHQACKRLQPCGSVRIAQARKAVEPPGAHTALCDADSMAPVSGAPETMASVDLPQARSTSRLSASRGHACRDRHPNSRATSIPRHRRPRPQNARCTLALPRSRPSANGTSAGRRCRP